MTVLQVSTVLKGPILIQNNAMFVLQHLSQVNINVFVGNFNMQSIQLLVKIPQAAENTPLQARLPWHRFTVLYIATSLMPRSDDTPFLELSAVLLFASEITLPVRVLAESSEQVRKWLILGTSQRIRLVTSHTTDKILPGFYWSLFVHENDILFHHFFWPFSPRSDTVIVAPPLKMR